MSKITEFTGRLHTVHAEIRELEQLSREALSEFNTLEKRRAKLEADILALETSHRDLNAAREQKEAELAELKREYDALEKRKRVKS